MAANKPKINAPCPQCGGERMVSAYKAVETLRRPCRRCMFSNRHEDCIQAFLGKRFGNLTVVDIRSGCGSKNLLCRCDCGKEFWCQSNSLKAGVTTSCGCFGRERHRQSVTTHGLSSSHTFKCWDCMRGRCERPSASAYLDYGGRGITVCERWKTFANFLADMGESPTGKHTIDRIDNDGNYEPGNCRWATRLEQQNNRRCNRRITIGSVTMTLTQWSREPGVTANYRTIAGRLNAGWPTHDAVFAPPSHRA